jgi:hypothetical protein
MGNVLVQIKALCCVHRPDPAEDPADDLPDGDIIDEEVALGNDGDEDQPDSQPIGPEPEPPPPPAIIDDEQPSRGHAPVCDAQPAHNSHSQSRARRGRGRPSQTALSLSSAPLPAQPLSSAPLPAQRLSSAPLPAQPRAPAASRRRRAFGSGTRSLTQPTMTSFLGAKGCSPQEAAPPLTSHTESALAAPPAPSLSSAQPRSEAASSSARDDLLDNFMATGQRRLMVGDVFGRRPALSSGTASTSKRPLTCSAGSDNDSPAEIKKARVSTTTANSRVRKALHARQASQSQSTRSIKRPRVVGDAPGRVHVQSSILAFCVRSQDIDNGESIGGEPAGSPVLYPDR